MRLLRALSHSRAELYAFSPQSRGIPARIVQTFLSSFIPSSLWYLSTKVITRDIYGHSACRLYCYLLQMLSPVTYFSAPFVANIFINCHFVKTTIQRSIIKIILVARSGQLNCTSSFNFSFILIINNQSTDDTILDLKNNRYFSKYISTYIENDCRVCEWLSC